MRRRLSLALLWAASIAAPALAQVQAQPRPAVPIQRPEAREVDAYLQNVGRIRSGCENAAWTLWHSNSYAAWRARRSSMLSMNYTASFFPTAPSAPASVPAPLRARLDDAMKRANDVLGESGSAFKDLANYINAKDYEDDKFKKGDELNTRLLGFGRDCFGFYAILTGLLSEVSEKLILERTAEAVRAGTVAVMAADWRRARDLSAELAKGQGASLARLDTLVADVSALADDRKRELEADIRDGQSTLARFYDRSLNERVAVKMRKLLRDAKRDRKVFVEASEDRPRSDFWQVRNEIDVIMPDAILSLTRQGR